MNTLEWLVLGILIVNVIIMWLVWWLTNPMGSIENILTKIDEEGIIDEINALYALLRQARTEITELVVK